MRCSNHPASTSPPFDYMPARNIRAGERSLRTAAYLHTHRHAAHRQFSRLGSAAEHRVCRPVGERRARPLRRRRPCQSDRECKCSMQ